MTEFAGKYPAMTSAKLPVTFSIEMIAGPMVGDGTVENPPTPRK
jgi:hypothetical protein